MKKLLGYLTVLTVCLACVGCGNDESSQSAEKKAETTAASVTEVTTAAATASQTTTAKTTKKTEKKKETTKKKENKKETTAEAETETEAVTEAEEEEVVSYGSYDGSDAGVNYGGYFISVGQDAASLPATDSVDAAPSCLGEGEDKVFHYGSIDVSTQPYGGSDIVTDITVLSGDACTPNGITVGSSLADAIAVYGEGTDNGGSYIWSGGGYMTYASVSGGVITSLGITNG